MIVTVTANPALDVTYRLDRFRLGESHRVQDHTARAGGKGINVASVLRGFGHDVVPTGVLGGPTGHLLATDLRARGFDPDAFVLFDGDSRRTINVVSDGTSTMLNEAGPTVDEATWSRLVERVVDLLQGAATRILVISGSLPPGLADDAYARLLGASGQATTTIVDAHGPALVSTCARRPTMVKPNRAELASSTGREDLVSGARALQQCGASDVLVSDGARGLILVPVEGPLLRARLTMPLVGNPTGAGDALAAALASATVDDLDVAASLRRAVAWSAAAVLSPVAGQVDPAEATRLADLVVIEELPPFPKEIT